MFNCSCGGLMLVIEIETYPSSLSSSDKLEYERKCTVECQKCHTVLKGQKYD